jgi:hypothetical protein
MKEQLIKHLKEGAPWEEMETPIPGVFIVKAPGPKSDPKAGKLMLKINPVDESGKPKKKKGLFLSDRETYIQFFEILSDDRINKILVTLEEVNPKSTKKSVKKLKMD